MRHFCCFVVTKCHSRGLPTGRETGRISIPLAKTTPRNPARLALPRQVSLVRFHPPPFYCIALATIKFTSESADMLAGHA